MAMEVQHVKRGASMGPSYTISSQCTHGLVPVEHASLAALYCRVYSARVINIATHSRQGQVQVQYYWQEQGRLHGYVT